MYSSGSYYGSYYGAPWPNPNPFQTPHGQRGSAKGRSKYPNRSVSTPSGYYGSPYYPPYQSAGLQPMRPPTTQLYLQPPHFFQPVQMGSQCVPDPHGNQPWGDPRGRGRSNSDATQVQLHGQWLVQDIPAAVLFTPVQDPVIPFSTIPEESGSARQYQEIPQFRPNNPRNEMKMYPEFANGSPHDVEYDDGYDEHKHIYPTSEHLFQALKFTHRPGLMKLIRKCGKDAMKAVDIAGYYEPDVRKDWKEERVNIMEKVLYLKFTQHGNLKHKLLSTGEEPIENWDGDDFWGCGDGRGRNKLGKLLMELRSRLRAEERRLRERERRRSNNSPYRQ